MDVWCGDTLNRDCAKAEYKAPDARDWNRIVKEVRKTQTEINILNEAGGGFLSQSKVYFDGNQTVPAAAPTKITFNNVSFDNNSEWDIVNNRFVAKEAGIYCVIGCILYPNLETIGGLYFMKNESDPVFFWLGDPSGTGRQINGSTTVQLNAEDYIEMWGFHMAFPSIVLSGGETNTFFSVHRVG